MDVTRGCSPLFFVDYTDNMMSLTHSDLTSNETKLPIPEGSGYCMPQLIEKDRDTEINFTAVLRPTRNNSQFSTDQVMLKLQLPIAPDSVNINVSILFYSYEGTQFSNLFIARNIKLFLLSFIILKLLIITAGLILHFTIRTHV